MKIIVDKKQRGEDNKISKVSHKDENQGKIDNKGEKSDELNVISNREDIILKDSHNF